MKKTRILCLLLALFTVLAVLASCGEKPEKDTPAGENTTPATEEVTTVPTVPVEVFFSKGDTNVKIVYASGSGSRVKSSDVSALVTAVNQRFGMSLRSSTDKTTKENAANKEILVGLTNREASANADKDLAASDFVVSLTGNQLVLLGGSDDATARAIRYFIGTFLAGEGDDLMVPEGLNYRWVFATEAATAIEVAKDYAVLFGEAGADSEKSAARSFAAKLASATGETVSAKAEVSVPNGGKYSDTDCVVAGKEVLIGHTNRRETNRVLAELGPLDWVCRAVGEKIVLVGSTADGTVQAVNYFLDALCQGNVKSLAAVDHTYLLSEVLTNPDSPAADYDAFVPVWASGFTVPAWMTSQNEKIYAVTAPDARNMSASIGGDGKNYPAHSLEALTSAVKAGVDLLVVNVYLTKDGIAVVAPGTALKLYTDVAKFAGKGDYPLSTDLGEWTYEQLRALHYTTAGGEATQSGICSLYEAIHLARGRCLMSFLYPGADLTETVKSMLTVQDAFDCYYEIDVTGHTMVQPKLVRTLRAWRNSGEISAPSLNATLTRYDNNLKLGNHWMRRLFTNDRVLRRGLTDPFCAENLRAWAEQGYNFFYATDVVSYCKYIATQDSAFVNEDFRPRSNTYTIEKSALGGRILVISDLHYYPINNSIGYTHDEKMELVVAQIEKEYNGRGLDAVVIVGDLSTDNDYYHMNNSSIPSGAELYDTEEKNGKTINYYRTSDGTSYTGYYRQVVVGGKVTDTGYLAPTNYGKDYYQIAQTKYLAPLSAKLNNLPIYVLPGNHDSDIDHRWFTTFGYERQFSALVKDTAIICLDTFNDATEEDENTTAMRGHGGDYRPVDFNFLRAELAKYPESTGVKRILIFAHYLSGADKNSINALAANDKRILIAFDGHTHEYNVEPYSNLYFMNDGDVSYTAMSDESGGWSFDNTGKPFGFLDVRNVWGYVNFEWGTDAAGKPVELTYHVLMAGNFTPYNMPGGYSVPEIKQDDIIVSRS